MYWLFIFGKLGLLTLILTAMAWLISFTASSCCLWTLARASRYSFLSRKAWSHCLMACNTAQACSWVTSRHLGDRTAILSMIMMIRSSHFWFQAYRSKILYAPTWNCWNHGYTKQAGEISSWPQTNRAPQDPLEVLSPASTGLGTRGSLGYLRRHWRRKMVVSMKNIGTGKLLLD